MSFMSLGRSLTQILHVLYMSSENTFSLVDEGSEKCGTKVVTFFLHRKKIIFFKESGI